MTEELLRMLEQSGWSPNRRVPVEQWTIPYMSAGFSFSADALRILENYGGLTVGGFFFNPLDSPDADLETLGYWEDWLETTLSPIASMSGGGLVFMGVDNRVYMTFSGVLWDMGSTLEDALQSGRGVYLGRAFDPSSHISF